MLRGGQLGGGWLDIVEREKRRREGERDREGGKRERKGRNVLGIYPITRFFCGEEPIKKGIEKDPDILGLTRTTLREREEKIRKRGGEKRDGDKEK